MSDRNICPSPAGTAAPFSFGSNFGKSWKYCSESLFVVLLIAEQSCQFLDLQDWVIKSINFPRILPLFQSADLVFPNLTSMCAFLNMETLVLCLFVIRLSHLRLEREESL